MIRFDLSKIGARFSGEWWRQMVRDGIPRGCVRQHGELGHDSKIHVRRGVHGKRWTLKESGKRLVHGGKQQLDVEPSCIVVVRGRQELGLSKQRLMQQLVDVTRILLVQQRLETTT